MSRPPGSIWSLPQCCFHNGCPRTGWWSLLRPILPDFHRHYMSYMYVHSPILQGIVLLHRDGCSYSTTEGERVGFPVCLSFILEDYSSPSISFFHKYGRLRYNHCETTIPSSILNPNPNSPLKSGSFTIRSLSRTPYIAIVKPMI